MTKRRDFFSEEFLDQIDDDPITNYFTPVLKQVFDNIQTPSKVCDIGCGNGIFTIDLKRSTGCKLTGVDGSVYALEQADKLGFDEIIHMSDFSYDVLELADETFDLVICKDVLEHLLRPENLVGEISRVLKNGGRAVIHVPNHFNLPGRLKLLFSNTIDPFSYFPGSNRWDFPHIRFFTEESLLELLAMHQLKLHLNLSHHFAQFPIVHRFMPKILKHYLSNKNPDLFSQGYTFLVYK